jgi:hypothetical protein
LPETRVGVCDVNSQTFFLAGAAVSVEAGDMNPTGTNSFLSAISRGDFARLKFLKVFLVLALNLFFVSRIFGGSESLENFSHPRLYFTQQELTDLKKLRREPPHAKIYKNLIESADWCLTKTQRAGWIAPVSPDPIYENLYDRFYAIMGDLAITEHLSFAYALSGKEQYGNAARQWVLASCRAWKREADGQPDGGKAYAVSRLLKGVAVGYDVVYDRFTDEERKEIRETLAGIANLYFEKYFKTSTISGPGFHTHHAIVEWGSFGVAALALLGEEPKARTWLDATVKKFEEHLLPTGLAPDGAQTEGGTFWASTMQSRIFFLDALRRVTGRNFFKQFETQMNADLALAEIATEKYPGYEQSHANVILQPYYGQLDYYAPILLFLAKEYRRPIFQYLAQWDHSTGQIQKTRAITPHGEQLLFELGGYAYLWCDASVPAKADEKKFSFHFPSVDEAYLRASWKAGDLLVGVSKGQLVIHAGGETIFFEPGLTEPETNLVVQSLEDNSSRAVIRCGTDSTNRLEIELNRAEHKLTIRRKNFAEWQWSCHGLPVRAEENLRWKNAGVHFIAGHISNFDPIGYAPPFATGFNKLKLVDPAPMKFPRVTVQPDASGEIIIEIKSWLPTRQKFRAQELRSPKGSD